MSRRSDQLNRIEASLARIERDAAAGRLEVRAVKEAADSAHAGIQALADMLATAAPAAPPRDKRGRFLPAKPRP